MVGRYPYLWDGTYTMKNTKHNEQQSEEINSGGKPAKQYLSVGTYIDYRYYMAAHIAYRRFKNASTWCPRHYSSSNVPTVPLTRMRIRILWVSKFKFTFLLVAILHKINIFPRSFCHTPQRKKTPMRMQAISIFYINTLRIYEFFVDPAKKRKPAESYPRHSFLSELGIRIRWVHN